MPAGLTRQKAALLFGLVLVLRLSLASQFHGNYDSESYMIAAQAVLGGQNVYLATERYNYSPVWSFALAGLWKAAAPNTSLFLLLIGALLTAADALSAWVILEIARRRLHRTPEESRRAALLFFSNPISVVVSSGHGQFDGIAILFLLVAILLATGPSAKRLAVPVVAALSASLLFKHITAFHPLLFWRGFRRPGYSLPVLAIPYAVFLASFWPYRSALPQIASNVLFYGARSTSSTQQLGGWQVLGFFDPDPLRIPALVLFAMVGWVIWRTRDLELPRAALLLFLANLTFLPSIATQYFVWPVALGALYPGAGFIAFSTAAAISHSALRGSFNIPWPFWVTPIGVWAASLAWFLLEMRATRAPAPVRPPQALAGAEA